MKKRKRGRPRLESANDQVPVANRRDRTSVGFTAEDLSVLAHVLAAGMLMLHTTRRHPVVSKVKAALTRLKLPSPAGL